MAIPKLSGGAMKWPHGLINSCKDMTERYSCAPGSLFDLLYFSVFKMSESVLKCSKGPFLKLLIASFTHRDIAASTV